MKKSSEIKKYMEIKNFRKLNEKQTSCIFKDLQSKNLKSCKKAYISLVKTWYTRKRREEIYHHAKLISIKICGKSPQIDL